MSIVDSKSVWARIFGFLIALGGILYLDFNRNYFIQADVIILSDIARYLPRQMKILGYGLILFIYVCFWNSQSWAAWCYRTFFWLNISALGVSYTILILGSGVSLGEILPLLHGEIKSGNAPWFWSWVAYLTIWFVGAGVITGDLGNSGQSNRDEVLIRGKKLITLDHARQIANNKAESRPGVNFGWLTVPDSQATTHFAVVGATGSGKTLLIRTLLDSVLPRVGQGSDSRALIYDAKRDMLPILSGMNLESKVITLHPFDQRGAAWDMAKDITSPASADQMASILIPQDKNSNNPFFSDAARALMTGVITVFLKKCPEAWTFRDVILALKSASRLKQVLSECEETKDLVEQYFSNEKTANDVMSTLATKIQRYQYIAAAWERATQKVSLKDWVNNEYILVLGNDEETRSAVDALNQVIFKRVTELVLNQSESFTRRTWVILDELKEAGMLPGLASLLSKGRSKGAAVVIGFQDIEGLSASMKDSRLASEIVGLCANKAILRLDSAETAKWASMQFGEQEVEQKKVSTSTGTSTQKHQITSSKSKSDSTSESWINHKKETIMPVEFLDLPPVGKSGSLRGYYIIPSIGSYSASIKMSGENSILSDLKPNDPDTPSFIERSKDEQFLRLWDDNDLERLKLKAIRTQHESGNQTHEEVSNNDYDYNPLDFIKRRK